MNIYEFMTAIAWYEIQIYITASFLYPMKLYCIASFENSTVSVFLDW